MSVYVGIDVHRKRSQVAILDQDGKVAVNRNFVNGSAPMVRLLGSLAAGTPVAFEAAYGWGWLVALLERLGLEPHMVHPLRCKAIASARLKNDKVDAQTLAQLLRADLLPEAWIAPPPVRDLRALVRHRVFLVQTRTRMQNKIHAVAADHGHDRPASYWTGPGRAWLGSLDLPPAPRGVIASCLTVIDASGPLIAAADQEIRAYARTDPRVQVLMTLPGVGVLIAVIIIAETGDITRFPTARKLAAWTGQTPTVRGSDLKVRHGHISKQGSPILRWALCQAAQNARRSPEFGPAWDAIAARRGKNIATTAIARKLACRSWHLLTEYHRQHPGDGGTARGGLTGRSAA
jgi:transposase